MADRLEKRGEHPVLAGLLALVGVGVVVGAVLGLAALGGARVLGVGEPAERSTGSGEASMFLPKPEKTEEATGPSVTLAPGDETASATAEPTDEKTKKDKKDKPAKVISLSAAQTEVSPMQQIDLSGVYPAGDGAILKVQRFENGRWVDFYSVTANVSGQTFSTYVQTGQPGPHRFRVVDSFSGKASNEVRVTVS